MRCSKLQVPEQGRTYLELYILLWNFWIFLSHLFVSWFLSLCDFLFKTSYWFAGNTFYNSYDDSIQLFEVLWSQVPVSGRTYLVKLHFIWRNWIWLRLSFTIVLQVSVSLTEVWEDYECFCTNVLSFNYTLYPYLVGMEPEKLVNSVLSSASSLFNIHEIGVK